MHKQILFLVVASFLLIDIFGEDSSPQCKEACKESTLAARTTGGPGDTNVQCELMPYLNCLRTNEKCENEKPAQLVLKMFDTYIKNCEKGGNEADEPDEEAHDPSDDHDHSHDYDDSASWSHSCVVSTVASTLLAVKLFSHTG